MSRCATARSYYLIAHFSNTPFLCTQKNYIILATRVTFTNHTDKQEILCPVCYSRLYLQ